MKLVVGTYEYPIKSAEQVVNPNTKQFYITFAEPNPEIETLYDEISGIIENGFTIEDTTNETFVGYKVMTIRRVFNEDIETVYMELQKGSEE